MVGAVLGEWEGGGDIFIAGEVSPLPPPPPGVTHLYYHYYFVGSVKQCPTPSPVVLEVDHH